MPKSWVIRSGRYGERDAWALQNGFSGGGWSEIGDLTACTTKEDVVAATRVAFPNAPDGRLSNHAGQLWALRGRIEVGDLMVLPLKTTKQIALGRVTSGYRYLSDQDDPDKRHVVSVDWQRHDLPRTAVKQDLLYTLGSAISIFAPSKNHAIDRLEHLLANGVDPGQIPSIAANWTGGLASNPAVLVDADGVVDEPELSADIEDVALTQIEARISEEFSGHGLTALVSDLLAAQGFVCEQSTPGPDGCLLYTSPSPRDRQKSRMPSSA